MITAYTKFKIDNKPELKLKSKIEKINSQKVRQTERKVFYVPAQRSLVVENGWTRGLDSLFITKSQDVVYSLGI